MLHLIHPALPRAAALDPYRFRHQALVAATSVVALGLLFSTMVTDTLAAASEREQSAASSQLFVTSATDSVQGAADGAESAVARGDFTVDVRPPLVYPVGASAPIGSPFGPREQACNACSTQHQGVDWNPGRGTPIVAIADGVVASVGAPGNTLGVYVTLEHVINGQAITSVYGHMEQGSLPWVVGDRVRGGDVVGRVGSTGVTTAPHLHFELRIGGQAINPLPWLAANGAQ